MLLQSKGFYLNEFEIPKFTLKKGDMIRFWVEIIPKLDDDTSGYWAALKIQESNSRNCRVIQTCPPKVRLNILDFIRPISTGKYLERKFQLDTNEVKELLYQFDIKPEYKIRNLGRGHQKLFSIICSFQECQVVSFDYFGLCPTREEQLTKFVKQEIKKGKAAISFDNLYFKPKNTDCENIVNLEIVRRRKFDKNIL